VHKGETIGNLLITYRICVMGRTANLDRFTVESFQLSRAGFLRGAFSAVAAGAIPASQLHTKKAKAPPGRAGLS
jgi:hypothetical protein